MPVPSPKKGEDQDKFMGRCMSFMMNENKGKPTEDKRPRKQLVAICFSQWKDGHKSNSSDEEAARAEKEFIKKFKKRHPEYAEYFEESDDGQNTTN